MHWLVWIQSAVVRFLVLAPIGALAVVSLAVADPWPPRPADRVTCELERVATDPTVSLPPTQVEVRTAAFRDAKGELPQTAMDRVSIVDEGGAYEGRIDVFFVLCLRQHQCAGEFRYTIALSHVVPSTTTGTDKTVAGVAAHGLLLGNTAPVSLDLDSGHVGLRSARLTCRMAWDKRPRAGLYE